MNLVVRLCGILFFAAASARGPCVDPSHLQCVNGDLRWILTPLLVRLRGVDYVQQIKNGCYKPSRHCDDWLDCRDGSDENYCVEKVPLTSTESTTTTSTSSLTTSTTTTTTSNPSSRCYWDNYVPCRNGSRSLDPNNEICIKSTWLCDGTYDCLDHSDEEGCTTVTSTTPKETSPITTTVSTTTTTTSEGGLTTEGTCSSGEQHCADGIECVRTDYFCDGVPDCADDSDELDVLCLTSTTNSSPAPANITTTTVSTTTTTTSEEGSTTEGVCPVGEKLCADGIECVRTDYFCDGVPDCADDSDELDVLCLTSTTNSSPAPANITTTTVSTTTTTTSEEGSTTEGACRFGEQHCADGIECVRTDYFCDGVPDCADDSDELDVLCLTSTTNSSPAPVDTTNHPRPTTTEETTRSTTTRRTTRRPTTTRRTLPPWTRPPPTQAPATPSRSKCHLSNYRYCPSGYRVDDSNGEICIKKSWMCDGQNDCSDGSDEYDCEPPETPAPRRTTQRDRSRCHRSDYVYCPSGPRAYDPYGHICIESRQLCDGVYDCSNLSDEWVPQTCQPLLKCDGCQVGYVRCPFDQHYINDDYTWPACIPESWMCNGYGSCRNWSDEDPEICGWHYKRGQSSMKEQIITKEEKDHYAKMNITAMKRSC